VTPDADTPFPRVAAHLVGNCVFQIQTDAVATPVGRLQTPWRLALP
jgi:hypothetical protein